MVDSTQAVYEDLATRKWSWRYSVELLDRSFKKSLSQAQWCITVIPAIFRRLQHKIHKFKIILINLVRPCLRNKNG